MISRGDLSIGQQAVQSTHAAIDFIFHHPDEAGAWHKTSNTLVSLIETNEKSLLSLSCDIKRTGVSVTEFREPWMNDQVTAIAFVSNEETRKLTKNLPLALKQTNLQTV